MKSIYAIAVVPFIAGALGACNRAHPTMGSADSPAPDGEDPGVALPPPGPQPNFGTVVSQKEPPPPISGGTLAMAPDHTTAIASDPDRDRVYIVDLPSRTLTHKVDLPKHSEPGRVTVDDTNHAYVVLRRSGGLATIDIKTGAVSIQDVCIAPRGIAWDGRQSKVHVACANGDLVSIATKGTGGLVRQSLERDLRDVVVDPNGALLVTTFRNAGSIHVSPSAASHAVPPPNGGNLAWRAISLPPDGGPGASCVMDDCSDSTAMVLQQPTPEPVKTDPGGYGGAGSDGTDGFCAPARGIITTQVKVGDSSVSLPEAVLPVDMATNGRELAIIAAGNAFTPQLPQIFVVFASEVRANPGGCVSTTTHGNVPGQAVAAVFDGDDDLVVQTREPAALHIMTEDRRRVLKTIPLADDSVADTGHAIFHANAGGFIACASCHAEGGDDGHVWDFVKIGPRRTPSLLGTIANTEPFHWDGDMKDMRALVDHVFVERMSGPKVDDQNLGALKGWLFALPELPKLRATTPETTAGAAIFNDRCTGCHSGAMLTNNQTIDVGTGGKFQVPSLVGVGWRSGFIHTGCARTLTQRFDPSCGGGNQHGGTQELSETQIQNLVQFLETL
jgi:hypothetical protein